MKTILLSITIIFLSQSIYGQDKSNIGLSIGGNFSQFEPAHQVYVNNNLYDYDVQPFYGGSIKIFYIRQINSLELEFLVQGSLNLVIFSPKQQNIIDIYSSFGFIHTGVRAGYIYNLNDYVNPVVSLGYLFGKNIFRNNVSMSKTGTSIWADLENFGFVFDGFEHFGTFGIKNYFYTLFGDFHIEVTVLRKLNSNIYSYNGNYKYDANLSSFSMEVGYSYNLW